MVRVGRGVTVWGLDWVAWGMRGVFWDVWYFMVDLKSLEIGMCM